MMRTHSARCAGVSTRIAIERPALSCISNEQPCSRAAVPGAVLGAVPGAAQGAVTGAVLGAIWRREMARR